MIRIFQRSKTASKPNSAQVTRNHWAKLAPSCRQNKNICPPWSFPLNNWDSIFPINMLLSICVCIGAIVICFVHLLSTNKVLLCEWRVELARFVSSGALMRAAGSGGRAGVHNGARDARGGLCFVLLLPVLTAPAPSHLAPHSHTHSRPPSSVS